MTLLIIAGAQQVAGDVLHFFGEQRRAVDLHQAQHAVRQVQLLGAFFQEGRLVRTFRVGFERSSRFVEGRRQFLGDDVQSLRADVGHRTEDARRQAPAPLALRIFPALATLTGSFNGASPAGGLVFTAVVVPPP